MDARRAERLYQKAEASRWKLPVEVLTNALERSAEKAHAGRLPSEADLDRYFDSLHLADLALACACAMGKESAWDHFVLEFRPAMYRAADAMDPRGGAREVADALYAELFGLREKDGIRQSLFRYFHGRSSLATWLRSVVAQRYIDRHREAKRLEPIAEEGAAGPSTAAPPADPDRLRYVSALRTVLAAAITALAPRDRLRLACYYAQEMTLAQIGRLTREHEATVSRNLARTRRDIRADVERRLEDERGFSKGEIDECFASVIDDAGNLDLDEWLGARKKSAADRSMSEAAEVAASPEKRTPR
jgi:RNA polymerase sigma-70 factor, ECF subfamily